jgi:predicted PurR-regulated permease PerM
MLLGTLGLIAVLFYQVIQPFLFSLLFATVLAVLFHPLYTWATIRLGNRPRLAASITTAGILLLILLPLGAALIIAGAQLFNLSKDIVLLLQDRPVVQDRQAGGSRDSGLVREFERLEESQFVKTLNHHYHRLSLPHRQRIQDATSRAADGFVKTVYEQTIGLVGDAINFVIGMVVTALALYYMLADGETLLRQGKDLFPLAESEEDALIDQFGRVCRGVIVGTVVAALGQAIMAGVGYAVAGVPNVLLLTTVTMFFAFIPFVGAGTVVTLISLWLALDGRYVAAGTLLLYNVLVVSLMDNVIRSFVIGSQAKMNPLVAFITVVGALKLIGLWGIFVGPLIAAFFYTLLKLLRERIVHEDPMLTASQSAQDGLNSA